MGKPKPYKAPFGPKGDLQHYPTPWWEANLSTGERVRHAPEWREVASFPMVLRYKGYARGRSAAYFLWEDADGHEYPMFLADLDTFLKRGYMNGPVMAIWIVCKRGANYGIRLANDKDLP